MTPSQVSALPVTDIRPIPRPEPRLNTERARAALTALRSFKPATKTPAEIDAMLAELARINKGD